VRALVPAWLALLVALVPPVAPDRPRFDHAPFGALLEAHVDAGGRVDYAGLRRDAGRLDAYLRGLETAPLDELGPDERLALLINAYNACTLRLILDFYPVKSIMDIPAPKRWADRRWKVGGHEWSLDQIEHEQIRARFDEPRVHFALVCAAMGCPPLRREAYAGDRLDAQLEDQARRVHGSERWFRFDRDHDVVWLTKLYDWYAKDFERKSGSVTAYAAAYAPDLKRALQSGLRPEIRWIDYDWSLNDQPARRPEAVTGRDPTGPAAPGSR
jgi:hypothetical protein